MFYDLYQKNNKICRIKLDENYEFLKVSEVYDSNRIPFGTNIAKYDFFNPEIDNSKFKTWWKSRFIPTDRQYLNKVFEKLKIQSPDELVSKTHCASLSDQYWTKRPEDNSTWEDINFYQNDFDDSVGTVLLLNSNKNFSEKSWESPDFTTDGQLPKKWLIEGKKRFLIKGCSSILQQEPFNEWLASEICEKLNISHVKYDVLDSTATKGEKCYFSKCLNFTDENTEFVPAYFVINSFKKKNNESDYQFFLRCSKLLNIQNSEAELTKMLFVDFLMANQDRHYRNFGFLRNSQTLEWKGLAPVFDTERSMFISKSIVKYYAPIDLQAKPFKDNHAEQFNLLSSEILKTLPLEELNNVSKRFGQLLSQNVFFSKDRINSLEEYLSKRINLALTMIEKNQKLKITKSRHQREIDRFNSLNLIVIN